MKYLLLLLLAATNQPSLAQHCPWDCSGMILFQSNLSAEQVKELHPVLVDENKKDIIDTIYGTGKDTYDPCEFLYFDEFQQYRTGKIQLHHWYEYDTMYAFAAGAYLVKYSYCKYRGKKLYIRYTDPYTRSLTYHYIEVPEDNRLHLHDYSRELTNREAAKIRELTASKLLLLNCDRWGLRENDCGAHNP